MLFQDTFQLHTPGGGGYGDAGSGEAVSGSACQAKNFSERGSVYEYRKAQESV